MLIFAHRGASGYQTENTLASMQAALDLGVEAVELDVHNVEGQLIVFHDRRLESKSTGNGLIKQKTLAELQHINIKGHPFPTLWQVLSLINGQCIVNIELKGDNTVAPMLAMYDDVISQLNFTPDQLLFSSFNHPYLAQLKQAKPHAYVAPLLGGIPLDLAKSVSDLKAYSLHIDLGFISQALIDDAHQRGAKVYVYTVDNPDDIRALQAIGVDGVFSNYPDRAKAAITTNENQYHGWFESGVN
ncbi:glycerophosphodiester phosphodiesterase family protein [Shewanella sp. ULN5]|uniref:glycerophosphodiester phosphodiesterase n=1 Tax=Shewanella sp. ULN5 TaxID=2994678 RepID=UPI00273D3942|nr:glycerophosphodiester phosphodiesterase family protein [Shewanella sp. ULN5]MDP5147537.1 glycerophosphodiester phosphodiesterase family protein [Shewanella sp. ULN5]